ncbi:hypothetical protein [Peptoniphilus harei]|uniref:amino acid kinase family protein n=1 Tax=Peptoniphilus harei TaxID=54005 RepID=UPI001F28D224|nr:hypothetical protein [Peptoniphilus harei]
MKVAKFGGSSLADARQLKKVKDIILEDDARKYIVVSAPGKGVNNNHKVTDLLAMCHELSAHELNFNEVYKIIENVFKNIVDDLVLDIDIDKILAEVKDEITNGASYDFVISRGEFISAQVLAAYLGFEFVDARDLIVFTKGVVDLPKSEDKIKEILTQHENAVVPGFYGENEEGKVNTFSRGGSDVTGSIIASALDAEMYENFTDVSGFWLLTQKSSRTPLLLDNYLQGVEELSYMGAKVLHEEAIFPLRTKIFL